MIAEIALVGSVLGLVVGLLEVAHRADERPGRSLTAESAVRSAMEGPEGVAVRAEFRRRGVVPPERRSLPGGFGL